MPAAKNNLARPINDEIAMTGPRTIFITGALTLLLGTATVQAQARSGTAPRPSTASALPRVTSTTGTPHDVLRAYGLGPNAGLNTGMPLAPRTGTYPLAVPGVSGYSNGIHATVGTMVPPQQGAPNTWFPSQTTGFSTAPLFPYRSMTFPYGYGFLAREPIAETAQELERERDMYLGRPEIHLDKSVATMDVRVPADAEVWVAGARTGQRGTARTYVSPHLEPDQRYSYEIRARWTEGGKEVDRTRQISVRAGETVKVDFSGK